MLELTSTTFSVVTAVAEPTAIESAMGGPGTYRIAPDELMAIGAPDEGEGALERIASTVVALDPDALVVDASDGWTAWSLRGGEARLAFTYLSSLELPDHGFVQGDVVHVPVRVVAADELLLLFVPAMWGAYLRERVLARCRVLQVHELGERPS